MLAAAVTVTLSILAAGARDEPKLQWSNADVGAVGFEGGFVVQGEAIEVQASGPDIWGAADGFHFVYVPWAGDVEAIARVCDVRKTHPWAKAGLMIRSDLTPSSPHAMVAMAPEQGATLLRRLRPGGPTKDDAHQAMRLLALARGPTYQQRGAGGVTRAVDSITAAAPPR